MVTGAWLGVTANGDKGFLLECLKCPKIRIMIMVAQLSK